MRNRFVLFAAAALLTASGAAQAGTVDLSPPILVAGDSGDVAGTNYTPNFLETIGDLANNSEIIFTYTLQNVTFTINSIPSLVTGSLVGALIPNAQSPNLPFITNGLLTATAALPSLSGGTTTFTNKSGSAAEFFSEFTGSFIGDFNPNDIKVHWVVVSTVPLPASALLFGLGLASIAGLAVMKRKQAQA
jgi:hypothetical protein